MGNVTAGTPPNSKSFPSLIIIISSTAGPVLLVFLVMSVLMVVLCLVIKRKKRMVKKLEKISFDGEIEGEGTIGNTYAAMQSLMSIRNPFEILSDYNLEYNYVLLEVVDRLGEGYFGIVYKSTAPGLSSGFVAVKTLKYQELDMLGKFAKEAWICAQFDHENVIKLLGICTNGAQKCMIFEYMELGGLDGLLRKSSPSSPDYNSQDTHLLTPYQFLNVSIQLARGLVYLSSLNFVHRDIASRNCLVDSSYTAKIADFGLSRNIGGQNYYRVGSGKNLLPIRWMPPEAIFFSTFTLKSDIWSFGVLLWEIYTYGRLPYGGLTNHEVIDSIRGARVLDKPDLCPLGVYDIMRTCWNQVPAKRVSMTTILERLETYERGEVIPHRNYANLMPQSDLIGPAMSVVLEMTPTNSLTVSDHRVSMETSMCPQSLDSHKEEGEELKEEDGEVREEDEEVTLTM